MSRSESRKVLYTLKTPCRDGIIQAAFDRLDFIARWAALVPKPRVNLAQFHGVLAPARPDRTTAGELWSRQPSVARHLRRAQMRN
ncbi:MAG: transposase [Halioglobus sp.]|nr:transposase [Halioglobus sp.]